MSCDDIIIEVPEEVIVIEMTPEGADGKDGNGIASIELISTVGLVKTYRITFTNGTHYDYEVEDGEDGADPEWGNITGNIADQTDLQNALSEKADIIHTSASGALVHITDAGAYPVDSLSVNIEPVQDLHGYDAPWPAGGGSNIWDEEWEVGGISTSTGGNITNDSVFRSKNYIPIDNSKSYYFYTKTQYTIGLRYYDSSKQIIGDEAIQSNRTISSFPTGTAYIRFVNASTNSYSNDIAINYPSTVHTYAPYSNICPISGHSSAVVTRTGRNLWDKANAVWYRNNSSNFSETTDNSTTRIRSNSLPIRCGGNTITVSGLLSGISLIQIRFYDKYKNKISEVSTKATVTAQSGTEYLHLLCGGSDFTSQTNQDMANANLQLELGSTATAYAPYNGTSVTIDLDGTRYGASLNVLTGEMTVNRAKFSTPLAEASSSVTVGTTIKRYGLLTSGLPEIDIDKRDQSICNIAKYIADFNAETTHFMVNYNATYIYVFVPVDTPTSTEVDVCYPLATPLTVQLSPATMSLLLGENNIWSDTGDTVVGYRADTKLYIDSKLSQAIAELQALILEH